MEGKYFMEDQKWMIELHNLMRVYGDGEKIYALAGIDLHVAPGELVAVMGPSGSGKSTLLNILGALDRPTSGEVFVNGQDLSRVRNFDSFRSHTVGFVFQLHNLLPTLTARENVEVPMTGHLGFTARHRRSAELLELVGLKDRMKHLPGQLSGGQRQRVAIARALANNPPLILADEPTGALDSASGKDLMNLVSELHHSQGITFVVVTHDPTVASQTHRVLVMSDGKIVREDLISGPLEEDLKMWRHSGLGQRIMQGDVPPLAGVQIEPQQFQALQSLLQDSHPIQNKGR
jgi:putative ABC transport system ATP-binding protein